MKLRQGINRKLYFLLLIGSLISIIAVLPFTLSLQGETLQTIDLSLPMIVTLSLIQSLVIFAITIYIGLHLAKKVGLHLPVLQSYIAHKNVPKHSSSIAIFSILIGGIIGMSIIGGDLVFTTLGVNIMEQVTVPIRQGFLASFYGAIGEEILLRLFFMTLIVRITSKFLRSKKDITKNNLVMWRSIVLTAIVFGIAHLPATAQIKALTPIIIFRALLLNGIGGIVFGRLYRKKGLIFAMIAHFTTDIVLYVLFPLLFLL